MFPATYFPATYFPPTYFPEVGGAATVPLASPLVLLLARRRRARAHAPVLDPDFLTALLNKWEASAINATVPLFFDMSPPGVSYPYAVIGEVTITSNPNQSYFDQIDYQINVYHSNMNLATSVGESAIAAHDAMLANRLVFANGRQMNFYRTGGVPAKPPNTGTGGNPIVYHQTYKYTVWMRRFRAYVNLTN